jgi:hypothetical protein
MREIDAEAIPQESACLRLDLVRLGDRAERIAEREQERLPLLAFTQRGFHPPPCVDIDVHADPFSDRSVNVAQRYRTRVGPAPAVAHMEDAMFAVHLAAGSKALR